MDRLTHKRVNGIKTGYWSAAKKEELIDRLAAFEDTGLEPGEVVELAARAAMRPAAGGERGWISVTDRLPEKFAPVILCREKEKGQYIVEAGCKDVGDWWKVYGTRTKKVTHWMPFPQPPEVGK